MLALPLAALAIYALSSAASDHRLHSLLISHRPSALHPLSCSLRSPHDQDNPHARNVCLPSHTPRAPLLSLFHALSPQAPYLSGHRLKTSPHQSPTTPS